jgi:iron complex transport system ATP-binding protein
VKAIEVEDLSFSIGEKAILRGVSLGVETGEFISIIGPNGAGKSTLLKCLVRVNRGWSGTVRLKGRGLGEYSQRELARVMSYVPQARDGAMPFTVLEFVLMGRYPYLGPFSVIDAADEAAALEVLEMVGMKDFARRAMRTLSGGERQKALIAGALSQGAEIMLLDEPTTFLDPRHEHEIINILGRINRDHGVTIVSVTHDINHAALSAAGRKRQ